MRWGITKKDSSDQGILQNIFHILSVVTSLSYDGTSLYHFEIKSRQCGPVDWSAVYGDSGREFLPRDGHACVVAKGVLQQFCLRW